MHPRSLSVLEPLWHVWFLTLSRVGVPIHITRLYATWLFSPANLSHVRLSIRPAEGAQRRGKLPPPTALPKVPPPPSLTAVSPLESRKTGGGNDQRSTPYPIRGATNTTVLGGLPLEFSNFDLHKQRTVSVFQILTQAKQSHRVTEADTFCPQSWHQHHGKQ